MAVIKIYKLFISVFVLTAVFCTDAVAINSYYTENNYEKTSTYAAVVDSDDKNINIDKKNNIAHKSKVIQDGNTKKIYTTIIVKSKKNKNSPVPVVAQKEQKKSEITVKPVNKKDYNDELRPSKKKPNDSILKRLFQKKTPDNFYLYALGGYSVLLSNAIKINAINPSGQGEVDDGFPTFSSYGVKKGIGYNFIVGSKFYLNKSKYISLFIGPEFFFSKLKNAGGDNEVNYDSPHTGMIIPAGQGQPVDISVNIPAKMSIETKNMYGGSIRLGFTMLNAISVFGKASIGGTRYNINSSLDINNANWQNAISPEMRQEIIEEQWSNPGNRNYIDVKSGSKVSKTALTYGLGLGFEITAFNQHVILRGDYDWFYVHNGIFSNGKSFSIKDGNKTTFRIRHVFSVARATIGFAF